MASAMNYGYWNENGIEQEKYNVLMDAIENDGWELTKKTENVFHSYYRYFNDGDFPGWARGDWSLRKMGRWGWELNDRGLEQQEFRVTEAIINEYDRLMRARKAQ